MASKVSSVIVRFRGDTRQLDKSVKGAEKRLTTMGKLGRTANLALAAGVAAAGTIIFSAAKQFDEAQGVIRNATGKTGEELKGLTDQLKAVTANSTQATTELAGAIGTIDTLFDGTDKQVGSLTETLADFARVAGGSLETQADSLGKIAAAYGESIGDTERALDTFVKVTADYAIGGDDLMTQLLKHGPTLQAFGLGMEESAVALGKLNAAGVQIRQWSSGVRVMLGYFLDAGLEPRKAMESLNQELLTASSRTEQLGLLSKWMDETAAVQYINAICAGVDVTADFTEEIEGATGAMDTMGGWDNMTLQQKIDEVKNKFISIGSDIADHIMPCLNKVADWLGEEGNIQIALGVIGGLFAVTLVAKVGTFIASIGRIGAALAAAATSPRTAPIYEGDGPHFDNRRGNPRTPKNVRCLPDSGAGAGRRPATHRRPVDRQGLLPGCSEARGGTALLRARGGAVGPAVAPRSRSDGARCGASQWGAGTPPPNRGGIPVSAGHLGAAGAAAVFGNVAEGAGADAARSPTHPRVGTAVHLARPATNRARGGVAHPPVRRGRHRPGTDHRVGGGGGAGSSGAVGRGGAASDNQRGRLPPKRVGNRGRPAPARPRGT